MNQVKVVGFVSIRGTVSAEAAVRGRAELAGF